MLTKIGSVIIYCFAILSYSQGTTDYGKGIRIQLDPNNEDKFIRFILNHQFWLRSNNNNPGTIINEKEVGKTTDFQMNRSRIVIHAQINRNFLLLTTLGMNSGSQSTGGTGPYNPRRPSFYIHDAWAEHRLYKDYISMGAGLHYWQGPSRASSASTMNMLGLDYYPMFNWQNIEATDQLARQYGVYIKGQLLHKKLDYRLAINFPYAVLNPNLTKLDTLAARNGLSIANYNNGLPDRALTGYFKYQFLEPEANVYPFLVGSYLGTKKIFNVGAGFYHQKNAMAVLRPTDTSGNNFQSVPYDHLQLSADAFLDIPVTVSKKYALNLYALYNYVDMGPNFIRNLGINNIATGMVRGTNNFNGPGNSLPSIGSGHNFLFQAGLLLPNLKKIGRFQPYFVGSASRYERLKDPVYTMDTGVNWLINGHSLKLTFAYRTRPVFKWADLKTPYGDVIFDQNKTEFITQVNIFF